MTKIKNIYLIALQNIKKWQGNYRIYFLVAYIIYFTYYINQNIGTACAETNTKISQWLLPFMFTYQIAIIYLVLPIVILFIDAPFLDNTQSYIIVRSKRKIWALGQILYIVIASFLYALFLMIMGIVTNIQNIEFTSGWGDFMLNPNVNSTLSLNPRGYFFVSDYIIDYFTPIQAMWFCFLILWIIGVMLGLIMFCLNSITGSRVYGSVCASFLVVLGQLASLDDVLIKFSPVSWVTLENIDVGINSRFPSFQYVMIVYFIIFAILITVILITNRKRTIEVLPPV